MLKLANKAEVKTTAETLHITADIVIAYRNKFNAGGIDVIMHKEQSLGRCGNGGILVSKKLQKYAQDTTSEKNLIDM